MKGVRVKIMARALLLVSLLFTAAAPTNAKDAEFDAVVKHVKAAYGGKRVRVPFLGLANFAIKIVRPAGVKSFKLATFEDLRRPAPAAEDGLSAAVRQALGPEWRPLVRVRERRDGRQVIVYVREAGKNIKLMVVNVGETEATVVRVKLNPQTLVKWVEDPKVLGFDLPVEW
jgi:hypothetical protein